jgi:hypothetical protein
MLYLNYTIYNALSAQQQDMTSVKIPAVSSDIQRYVIMLMVRIRRFVFRSLVHECNADAYFEKYKPAQMQRLDQRSPHLAHS